MQPIFQPRRPLASDCSPATSRRRLVSDSVRLMAVGALTLTGGTRFRAAAQPIADLERLNDLLALEELEEALYREALTMFGEEGFDAERPASVYPSLSLIRRQEAEHVAALRRELGDRAATAIEPDQYVFGYKDIDGFLVVAAAIENVGVAAYVDAIPTFVDRRLLATLVSIVAVEARHSAYLNARLALSSFPKAFDPSTTPASVRAVIDLYTVKPKD